MPKRLIVCIALALVAMTGAWALACGAASSSGTLSSSQTQTKTTGSGVSFSKDIQPVFDANCVICHQGSTGPAGLSLQSGASYNNLVNVKSTESPLQRVSPSAPDKSYLLNKLLGTQGQVGGSGAQMPFGASPLSPSQISLIQQWIQQGALNN